MKFFFVLPLIGIALIGCTDEPADYTEWDHYVSFVNPEGSDFFDNESEYDRGEVRFMIDNRVAGDSFEDSILVDNIMAYRLAGIGSFFYFSFGNGDVDTLTYEVDYNGKSTNWLSDVSTLRYYYNGDLIVTWDFDADPDLRFLGKITSTE